MRKSLVIVVVVLVLTPLLAAPARAAEGGGESNLLFSIAVVDTGPEGQVVRRSTRILALDGTRADLTAGWRVPIPTKTAAAEEGGDRVTSYSYQDVGFLAWIDGRITGNGGVHASGRIEVSSVEPGASVATDSPPAPTIANFTRKFDVALDDGEEVTLAETPGPGGGSMSLMISVKIQR